MNIRPYLIAFMLLLIQGCSPSTESSLKGFSQEFRYSITGLIEQAVSERSVEVVPALDLSLPTDSDSLNPLLLSKPENKLPNLFATTDTASRVSLSLRPIFKEDNSSESGKWFTIPHIDGASVSVAVQFD